MIGGVPAFERAVDGDKRKEAGELGMLVASSLLEDEAPRLCGRRSERQPHRTHRWYGHQRGTATLAGQKIPIARPRVRRTDGGGEVPLETYARLQSPEAMPEAVLRRVVRGAPCLVALVPTS